MDFFFSPLFVLLLWVFHPQMLAALILETSFIYLLQITSHPGKDFFSPFSKMYMDSWAPFN